MDWARGVANTLYGTGGNESGSPGVDTGGVGTVPIDVTPNSTDEPVSRPSTAPYVPGGGDTPVFNPRAPRLGGPISLSLYGNTASFAGLDVFTGRSSGFRVSDTAGLIANPNALSPGSRSWQSGAGLNLAIDASGFFNLDANRERLWFGLTGDFHHDEATFQASTLTPGGANAHAASSRRDIGAVAGSANYVNGNNYLSGFAAFDLSHADITNNFIIPGAEGHTDGRGFTVGATAGRLFPLINTIGVNPAILVKAPRPVSGGYAVFLDASGHYLYRQLRQDGFTDSSGFVYGAQDLSYNDLGAKVRLMAVLPDRGFSWMPFVGVTFDKTLGLNYTFDVPAQAALPADRFTFSPDTTFWGAEAGLDILSVRNAKFGMRVLYQASGDTQIFGGSAFLRIPFDEFVTNGDSGIRIASRAGMPLKAPPPPAVWNWTGLYFGPHLGAAASIADFADPFGPSIYGDRVRSPGFLGGAQLGYNWQAPGSRWVLGVETDASLIDSDGSNTCFAASATTVNSTCRVRPSATATLTGRFGYAFDPAGRTIGYVKGGLAWAGESIDMALNAGNNNPARRAAPVTFNSQDVGLWGETVGIGVEHALTPAWSLKVEYDYLHFGNVNVANLGTVSILPVAPFTVGVVPPGVSGLSQDLHEIKLGLNYKWGANPWAPAWTPAPTVYANVLPATGWEVEGGGRYFSSWGQFKKTFGLLQSLAFPPTSDISRLSYDGMQSHSGEIFGRLETPWNVFIKGYAGGGDSDGGHMNDEDNVIVLGPVVAAYSNTLSPAVDGNIRYGVIDAGFDFLRGPGYRVGAFAGYFALNQKMNAFGCVSIASVNCTPNPVPTSGAPVITEDDKWRAARIGVAAETMLTDRIKISADAAWLPWVRFSGVDQHFVGNTGVLAENIPASGHGRGVQLEAIASYYITPRWSVGVGARYWGMWTTPNGQLNFTFPPPTTPFQYFRAQVEQFGAFVQTSYRFDWATHSMD